MGRAGVPPVPFRMTRTCSLANVLRAGTGGTPALPKSRGAADTSRITFAADRSSTEMSIRIRSDAHVHEKTRADDRPASHDSSANDHAVPFDFE